MKETAISFLLIFLLIVAISWIKRKKINKDVHFDERQLIVRADGYRISLFVTFFALLLLILTFESGIDLKISPTLGMFIVLMIGAGTFAVYCIMKDVYFYDRQNVDRVLLLWIVIVVLNGIASVIRLTRGTLFENGVITFGSGGILVSEAMFLIALIAVLIRRLRGEKEEDDE